MTRLHLDYETASDLDLKKVGGYKYCANARILMLGWAFDDEAVKVWQPHLTPPPPMLIEGLKDPSVEKHAFNAQFERGITKHCLGIDVPYDQWRCTMVSAYYLGFAGGLDAILKAIGLETKDDRGKRLINVFSKPAPKNHKATWYNWENKPAEWQEFVDYCYQDVVVERRLYHWMRQFPSIHDWDWQQWFLDQEINDRGVPFDVDMAESALTLWEKERDGLTEELAEATGLPRVTRGPFIEWLSERTGVVLDNTRKDYLAALLKKGHLPDDAKYYIDLWSQKEAKATTKYNAIINATGDDGRARGMFQYKGASRTDRVGGRLIQLQNLKRPFSKPHEIEPLVSAIKLEDPKMLRLLYGRNVSDILGGSIRHAIHTPMTVCDLSSIESVVAGWVCQCDLVDETFRAGRDTYKVFAEAYFGVPYEEVTKAQRTFSKPPVLGASYGLGWRGMVKYAEGMGVTMTNEEAKKAVSTYRSMYPEIVSFWQWITQAVMHVTLHHTTVEGYRLRVERDEHFLRIWLPSGRALSYYKPEVIEKKAPWRNMTDKAAGVDYDEFIEHGWSEEALIAEGYMRPREMIDNFSYMGTDIRNQWVRITNFGGGILENIVQSIAGDILWSGITNANAAGLKVILHVHDEIAVEGYHLDTLRECMTRQPAWAQDMWLGADGFTTTRYTKD